MPSSRKLIRRELRQRRAALPTHLRQQAAHAAMHRVSRLPWFRKARHIALYFPFGAELDATVLTKFHAHQHKHLYLPVLVPGTTPRLLFAPWQANTRWRRNRYNIAEPIAPPATLRRPMELDLVIAPLLGFDAGCNRLGAGGGYYDRSFAQRLRAPWRNPKLVGVAFECQRLAQAPVQHWDVALDAVATEQQVYWRQSRHKQGDLCATG